MLKVLIKSLEEKCLSKIPLVLRGTLESLAQTNQQYTIYNKMFFYYLYRE